MQQNQAGVTATKKKEPDMMLEGRGDVMVIQLSEISQAMNTLDNTIPHVLLSGQQLENCICDSGIKSHDLNNEHEVFMPEQEEGMKQLKERVKVGTDVNGKPVYKWACGHTNQELLENAARLLLEHGFMSNTANRNQQESSGQYFNDYAWNWFETIRKPTTKHQRGLETRGILKNYIMPYFAGKRVNEIHHSDIAAYFAQARIQKLAMSTAGNHGETLTAIFDLALRDDLVTKNPVTGYKKYLPKRKKTREALSAEEIRDVIDQLPKLRNEDELLLSLYIFSGIRRGEALAVQKKDIDIVKKTITISKGISFKDNQPIVNAMPKTEAGIRTIPLLEGFPFELLQGMSERDYILGGDMPWTESKYKRAWERIKKTIDLHGATAHIFRHTYATMAISSGGNMKIVQGILGHSTASTTMNIYAHTQQKQIAEAGNQLNGMYGR